MDIDRRRLLASATCAVLTAAACPVWPRSAEPNMPAAGRSHPLTRSLLDRARRVGTGPDVPGLHSIERAIRRMAEGGARDRPPVIKWLADPSEAIGYLNRFSLNALLSMGTASFWRATGPSIRCNEEAFERTFEVRCLANDVLRVEQHDRALMAPKLAAKSEATHRGAQEVFRIRAVLSQIGWLETSLAAAAAQAICDVELALHCGMEDSSVIDRQLRVFEAYEVGLFATWETSTEIVCIPRPTVV
jgi:hypothetical protein